MSGLTAVSVICVAYNQEAYIREAIESFLMQKTSFTFEILIHDDASKDRTPDIIREYEKKYPDIVKPIYEAENQYSKKVDIIQEIMISKVRGKYIALCEGDDYWTDPLKLQRQYEVLEENQGINICAHCAECVDAETKMALYQIKPAQEDTVFTVEQVIEGGGGFVATNSLFYRTEIEYKIPDFRKMLSMDWTCQIHGSLKGGMLYLGRSMSAYRIQAKGSWTQSMSKDLKKLQMYYNLKELVYKELDKETGYRFSKSIEKRIRMDKLYILQVTGRYRDLKREPYIEIYRALPLKQKISTNLRIYFPILFKLEKE